MGTQKDGTGPTPCIVVGSQDRGIESSCEYPLICNSLLTNIPSHQIDALTLFQEQSPNSIISAQQIVPSQVSPSASNSSTAAPEDTQMLLVCDSGF